jgi:23S rRNA pseudouridine1911/1915/1917 synthase
MANRELKQVLIPEGLSGERVDAALSRLLGISRTVIVELIDKQEITKNGKEISKSHRVETDEHFEVLLPDIKPAGHLKPTPIDNLKIIYVDDDLIVIDKPVGIAAHPSPGWEGPTVNGAIIAAGYEINTSGVAERQGIVQRLDVGTSGLMIVSRNEKSYSQLKEQFRSRSVKKIYHAMIQGRMDPSEGTIDAPLDRHPRDDYKFAVTTGGKPSITHYRSLEHFPAVTLIEVELETGRTHQIRVHFSALHHPLVGDLTYGADHTIGTRLKLSRPWLHACKLEFQHPRTGEQMVFSSEYPIDLAQTLEILRHSERNKG